MSTGIVALFDRRADADLAVEHLVQECGVERAVIFLDPAQGQNSAGTMVSGGDARASEPSPGERHDGALNAPIRLTVGIDDRSADVIQSALASVGARSIERTAR